MKPEFNENGKRIDCFLSEDKFLPCNGLDQFVEPEANHASFNKGLVQVDLFNIRTGKVTVLGVAMIKFKQKLMLNHCPFCGADLRVVIDKLEAEKKAKAESGIPPTPKGAGILPTII